MRRRLFFLLPNVDSARILKDELIKVDIATKHQHFYARDGILPADLPVANVLQKTDVLHSAEVGMGIGGIAGLLAGGLWLIFPPESWGMRMLALLSSMLVGSLYGAWASARAAATIPSPALERFSAGLDAGLILLMLDVPLNRVQEIQQMLEQAHPDYQFGGIDAHVPILG